MMKKQKKESNADVRLSPDSDKQIADSMEGLGPLWQQLCEAFMEAINRVGKRHPGESQLSTNNTMERKSEGHGVQ
jgi:hypothetical protein